MSDIKDLVLTALSDDELAIITMLVYDEEFRRMKMKSFPVLLLEEKELILDDRRLDAMTSYRKRNNLSARETMFVIKKYQDEQTALDKQHNSRYI